MKSKKELTDELLNLAFAEDVGDGDHTTLSTIPADAMGRSRLIIKEEGVLSGVDIAREVLAKVDPSIKMEVMIEDGAHVKPGDVAFTAQGPVRSLLEGLHTKVLDTRKTTPGMRMLEKEAVKAGGGMNHRIGLFDMILIKDNHIDFAGGIEKAIEGAKEYCRENGKNLKIEVEARSLDDVRRILEAGGVDRVMFDNFTPELTAEAVKIVGGRMETESSGGITLENLKKYGETGVDFISVGALTHSVKGLDMSFKAY